MGIKKSGLTPSTLRRPDAGGASRKTETQQTKAPTKTGQPAPGVADQMERAGGAQAALQALAMTTKTPERKEQNAGAEATTLGAKMMGFLRGDGGKKVYAAVGLGVSLLGMVKPASAQVVQIDQHQNQALTEAAQKIAQETGEPYVQVNAEQEALDDLFAKAEAGELTVNHLILNYQDGKAPSSYQWKQLQQKYPNAFDQVEMVHVLGSNLQSNPFKSYQGDIFKNAKAIVSFDLSTTIAPGPASSWVLQETTKALEDVPAEGLSTQDALIHATNVANKGAAGGVRTRVDIGDQSHVQTPENAMSEWLDARVPKNNSSYGSSSQDTESITRAELETKLKELSETDAGLTDGMLGVLNARMKTRGFPIDYDAARLAKQLIDVHVAGSPDRALAALNAGDVAEVRHQLAAQHGAQIYEGAKSELFQTQIVRGVPLAGNEAIPTGDLQGAAYLVDGMGTIKHGEVNVQSIHHPKHGDGYQLTFKLGDRAGHELETWLQAQGDTRLVDKTVVNQSPTDDGRVVTAESGDVEEAEAAEGQRSPEMSIGPALRFEKDGKYRVDYFPESTSKQSLRGEVHIQVYGRNTSKQKDRLRDVLEDVGLKDVIEGQPSEATEEMLKAFRLLEQSDPRAHHTLMDKVENGETVTIEQLHDALIAAEVPPAFLQDAYFAEASPGHMSVIVPGQAEAYGRRGVRSLYHTIGSSEIFAYIANDGALMSTKDRLAVGKVFRGMSSDTDLRTGGADYVFTRQVTEPMGNPSMSGMRGGAIVLKQEVLDRADWFAYSGDKYGTTLAGDRGEPTDAVKEIAQRSYDELKEQDDSSVKNKTFDQWFERLVKSQTDRRQDTYLPRPVGRAQVDVTTGSSNETMLEGTIPIEQIEAFLVRDDAAKEKTIAKLQELGVTDINGVPIEDFVQVRDKYFTEDQMQEFESQQGDKVSDPSQDLRDERLQFYVKNNLGADDDAPIPTTHVT